MEISERLLDISQLVALLCWTAVYILMVKRGVQDRSFGMPLAALAIDISWECYFTFFTGAPWSQRIPAMPWFVLNLGVLYTAYRYGREDFDWPILKRWFRTILTLMLLVAFWLVYSFIKAFDDSYGALTSMFAVIGYSTLLPVMLIRRNSIKGQSIYIALLILLGDAAGYIPTMHAQAHLHTPLPAGFMHAVYSYALPVHVFYVWLVWWVARRDGINPWTRL